jgi:hypothetical protein
LAGEAAAAPEGEPADGAGEVGFGPEADPELPVDEEAGLSEPLIWISRISTPLGFRSMIADGFLGAAS